MSKLILSILLLITPLSAEAFFLGVQAYPSYVGQVGSRAWIDDQEQSVSSGVMEKGYSYLRDNVSSIQIGLLGWYAEDVEHNTGNSFTDEFSVLDVTKSGACTRMTWSSSTSTTTASGATNISDSVTFSGSAGDKIEWYWYRIGSGTVNFPTRGFDVQNNGSLKDTANGDAISIGGSDVTATCGTVTDAGSTQAMSWPALILAPTRLPSVFTIGDSRCAGIYDSYSDGAGYIGDIERSIGPNFGSLSSCVAGIEGQEFISSHTLRVGLSLYFSTVIDEFGINDIQAGATAAQTLGFNQTIAGYFGTKPVFLTTLEPISTSTNSFATTGGQTTSASYNAPRASYNALIRSAQTGIAGDFDITSAIEFGSVGNGIWNAPGYTSDGTHELQAANIDILTAKVIPPSAIHR